MELNVIQNTKVKVILPVLDSQGKLVDYTPFSYMDLHELISEAVGKVADQEFGMYVGVEALTLKVFGQRAAEAVMESLVEQTANRVTAVVAVVEG
jgi:hypothetical protein